MLTINEIFLKFAFQSSFIHLNLHMLYILSAIAVFLGVSIVILLIIYNDRSRKLSALTDENSRLKTSLAVAEQRLADERDIAGERFRMIATEVMNSSSRTLEDRTRLGLEAVLGPVKESLDGFTRDFKACYSTDRSDRDSLREGLRALAELNRATGEETRRLASALRGDTGFQGKWGEAVLTNILEHAGLEEGRWVVYQQGCVTDEGRRVHPDAVITLPGGRKLAVDAKCSLTDYLRSLEATDDLTRDALLKAHVRSVESHFKCLADKQYNTLIGNEKVSFTVMFMPHEGAFAAAMQSEGTLWQRAFEKNVVIVSPTLLTVLIKLVEQMWVREDRDNNSRRIAEEAARMLDKLYAAFDDLLKAGRDIDRAAESCRAALSKLNQGPGNVVTRARNIVGMGARPSKQMPRDVDQD